ncbi:dual specificity protein phosphatase family protein [Vibrio alginolyticus]|uniref:diacylglycerol kinase family protein n=1 Tax=Vibrio alginolyticus TaxID=663 RepID=UPI001BD51097|nr:diacylglycerol kinase family protein [Vibrio alginolyticus]MBS9808848.1 dual specificity protein phosphatase family protein [Vibrio alginolyticus]
MFIIKYYILGALISLLAAIYTPQIIVSLLFLWISLSLALVSVAYVFDIPSIFRKNQDGKIVRWIRWAFIPFLLGARAYNAWERRRDTVPPIQKVSDNLYLSRRLFQSDLDFLESNEISCIVDVTAEFAGLESAMTDKQFHYLSIPVLDHKAPTLERLRHAINWIDTQISCSRAVVVHCALGRGRSVFVVAAYLLSKDPSLTVESVMKKINDVRSTARLNKLQIRTLRAISEKGVLGLDQSTWMVVNPVSGGGKWEENEQHLIRELTKKYRLSIHQTTTNLSAEQLTQQAKESGAKQIIVAGGDGTVTEVASQLVDTDLKLGIVPLGTANALCHVLYGVGAKFSPVEKACEALLGGHCQRIDTADCNQRLILLVLGIGLEQKMIEHAQREEKNVFGQLAYLTGFFNAVVAEETQALTVSLDAPTEDGNHDNNTQTLEVHSFVVANIAPFSTLLAQGGDAPQPDDGKLHITYLDNTESLGGRLIALSELTLTSVGAQEESTHFQYATAQSVTISANKPIEYVIDGELYSDEQLAIKLRPKSLNVFVPSQRRKSASL